MTHPSESRIINKILAVVGDKVITQYEVESFNPSRVKEIYAMENEEKREEVLQEYYKNILDFLVEQYTIEIAAEREGVVVEDSEVESAVNDVLNQNNITLEQLKGALEERGMTLAKYKWQIRMDILRSRIMSKIISPMVVITDADVKKYINSHESELDLMDTYELRMIEVKSKEKLEEVKKFLRENSFSDAAIKYSEAPNAKLGGYVGTVGLNQVSEDIAEHLKDANAGDMFTVKREDSFQLFLVESFYSKYHVPEEKRKEIEDKIREEKIAKIYENWLQEHKKTIYTKYYH
jgi:peptidyl-prolyl cis-trans isomerase SurA